MNQCPISTNPRVAFLNRVTASGQYDDDDNTTIYAASSPFFVHVLAPVMSLELSPVLANLGETIQYTITLANGSTLPLVDIILELPLPQTLLPQGGVINGVPISAGEISRGIQIPGIGPGGSAVIIIDVVVLSGVASEVTTAAVAYYRYPLESPSGGSRGCNCLYQRSSVTSNEVTLNVFSPVLELIQTADQTIVTSDQPNITYTVTAVNRGDFEITGLVLTDPLDAGMTFVAGSVTVNGESISDASPIEGIEIGSLAAGASIVVTYQVRIAV